MWLFALTLGWLAGLALSAVPADTFPPLWPIAAAIVLLLAAVFTTFAKRWGARRCFLVALSVAAAAAGFVRGSVEAERNADRLAPYTGQPLRVTGVVASTPEAMGQAVRFVIRVKKVERREGPQPASGLVQVTARLPFAQAIERGLPAGYAPGDVLLVEGKLKPPGPVEGFDLAAYLELQGIWHVMVFPKATLMSTGEAAPLSRAIFTARMRLAEGVRRSLPEPEASLAEAFVLGLRHTPPEVNDDFRRSGAAHLLSISGQHIGVLLGVLLWLGRPVAWRRHWLGHAAPLAAIWLYVLLAGSPVSAVRAAIMASLYLFSVLFGRQRSGWDALLWAAFLITLAEPNALRQVSFQLSFLAMAGILLVAVPVMERVPHWGGTRGAALRALLYVAALSAAASLATLPALAFYFHQVSLMSLPSTVLTLAALPLALAASFATALVGATVPEGSLAIAWTAWLPLHWTAWTTHTLAGIPFSSLTLSLNAGAAVGAYAGMALALWLAYARGLLGKRPADETVMRWEEPAPLRALPVSVAALSVAAVAVWWPAAAEATPPLLRVHYLGVDGEAVLIEAPGGERVLVDGGGDPRQLRLALDRVLGYRRRRLDMVVLTSAQPDRAAGLYTGLDRYDVRSVLVPPPVPPSGDWEAQHQGAAAAWRKAMAGEGVRIMEARAGTAARLGGKVVLEVLHPPSPLLLGTSADAANNSLVLRLAYGKATFLFQGGLERVAEEYLAGEGVDLRAALVRSRFVEKGQIGTVTVATDGQRLWTTGVAL